MHFGQWNVVGREEGVPTKSLKAELNVSSFPSSSLLESLSVLEAFSGLFVFSAVR